MKLNHYYGFSLVDTFIHQQSILTYCTQIQTLLLRKQTYGSLTRVYIEWMVCIKWINRMKQYQYDQTNYY